MLGEPGMGPNVVQEHLSGPPQSFKRWRKRLVAWILHLSATDPPIHGTWSNLPRSRSRLRPILGHNLVTVRPSSSVGQSYKAFYVKT